MRKFEGTKDLTACLTDVVVLTPSADRCKLFVDQLLVRCSCFLIFLDGRVEIKGYCSLVVGNEQSGWGRGIICEFQLFSNLS